MKLSFSDWLCEQLARYDRWQIKSLIRLMEEDARLRIEESQRIQQAAREWMDDYCARYPVCRYRP